MRIVFNAANSLEAHMIQELLSMQGIESHIHGEHLQSGVGELPAMDLVKVSVQDGDFSKAKEIIQHWEAQEIAAAPKSAAATSSSRLGEGKSCSLASFLLGITLGAIAVYWHFQSPTSHSGVDFDADGRLDEFYTYRNDIISKLETDRNFDGKIDYVINYDPAGLAESASVDDNFDGVFETTLVYQNNQITYEKSDSNDDGEIDLVTNYHPREPVRVATLYDLKNGRARKEQRYEMGKLVSADWDSDNDGIMDTTITYDAYEEEISRKPKTTN